MAPADYLASSYYERWLASLERLLVEKGVVSPEELERRIALLEANPDAPLARAEDPQLLEGMRARLTARPSYERDGPGAALRRRRPRPRPKRPPDRTHARCRATRAASAASSTGRAAATSSRTRTRTARASSPSRCYSVRFEARELWGESAEAGGRRVPRPLGELPGAGWRIGESKLAPRRGGEERA